MQTSTSAVNPTSVRKLVILGAALSAPAVWFWRPAQAAPRPNTLSFDMTARFSYKDPSDSAPVPQQIVNAKFYILGNKARIESELAGSPLVVLYAPPYAYRLSPGAKSGIRYKAEALPDLTAKYFGSKDFIPNPGAIRSSLLKAGARKTGAAKLNGQTVDVYQVKNFKGQNQNAKAWLRRADALPLRFELTAPKLTGVASWSNYQKGRALPASMFAVPKGYRIIDRTRS
jgi:hypothetical protein